ncbi:hypothetical protein SDC9_84538 [bioreactor metagenome]|uniref:Uncharacterized protein n=1 Tax=bioreactor metagenome TaxID=1076179 RepID=A0A644ZB57_9ZZZZ
MLACKNDHGIVKHKHIVGAAFLRTLSFVMNDASFGKIVVLISGFENAV